ncbi:MAG: high-potential iron-sulfur protein [Steroidobacteraceae bacterium]
MPLGAGSRRAKQAPCQIFAGKDVVAGGWCASWEPQI